MKKQLLLAHRGYSAIAPENTQLSFDLAELYGFDGIEIDVHFTKDRQLVIIHDETTQRTGIHDHLIATSTLAELQIVDLSAFFKVTTPKQTILTLEAFLNRYLDSATFKCLNIEIKTDIQEYEGIEEQIHIVASGFKNAKAKLLFSSFNFQSLEKMHALDSEWKLGFLFWTKKQLHKVDKKRIQAICDYLHPWTKIYHQNQAEILEYNLPLCLWTIKSDQEYHKLVSDKHIFAQISNYMHKK